MKTFGHFNQKGGVGKTTLSVHLAAWLTREFPTARTMLLDVDPQGNAQQWANERKTEPLFSVFGKASDTIHKQFAKISAGYDFVVIDAPANVSRINGSAILCCDTVLVPVQPSGLDLWASEAILAVIEGLQGDSARKSCFLMNRKIENTVIGNAVYDVLRDMPIPALKNTITQRIVWGEAMTEGKTVFEVAPKGPAVREIDAVFTELMEFSQ